MKKMILDGNEIYTASVNDLRRVKRVNWGKVADWIYVVAITLVVIGLYCDSVIVQPYLNSIIK